MYICVYTYIYIWKMKDVPVTTNQSSPESARSIPRLEERFVANQQLGVRSSDDAQGLQLFFSSNRDFWGFPWGKIPQNHGFLGENPIEIWIIYIYIYLEYENYSKSDDWGYSIFLR